MFWLEHVCYVICDCSSVLIAANYGNMVQQWKDMFLQDKCHILIWQMRPNLISSSKWFLKRQVGIWPSVFTWLGCVSPALEFQGVIPSNQDPQWWWWLPVCSCTHMEILDWAAAAGPYFRHLGNEPVTRCIFFLSVTISSTSPKNVVFFS